MHLEVRKLQRACLRNYVKIEVASKYSTVDTLKQQYRFVPAKYKESLQKSLNREAKKGQPLIFVFSFSKLMRSYCNKRLLDFRTIKFFYNGVLIRPKATPNYVRKFLTFQVFLLCITLF